MPNQYMVWAVRPYNLRRAFIDADTSLEARKKYAAAYELPDIRYVAARRLTEEEIKVNA